MFFSKSTLQIQASVGVSAMSIELKEAEYALKNKMLIQRKAWQDFGCNIKLHESETLAPYPPVSEGFQTGP